ncbi:unnamed protein product [Danaus chrysippus]|uniref:(African queen) hypothetical protein n=1 Tax=Danaus chrysippus TaxID=151541 RepID=A0A8J2Q9W6_9NEOP|nr:unnamed protein product [Danaus chrysippus]
MKFLYINKIDLREHYSCGNCSLSVQWVPTAQSTPRATPYPPSASPSEDVVRIHVTYNPLASPSHLQPVSPSKYKYDHHKPVSLNFYTNGSNVPDNRIRIQVSSEELLTPIVDSGRIIAPRYIDSHPGMYDYK